MLQINMKRIIAALLFAVVALNLFGADDKPSARTDTLITRYVNQANDAYEKGDLDVAYKNINAALTLSKTSTKTNPMLITTAQLIYRERLNLLLRDKYDGQLFVEMKNYLEQFPAIENASIKRLKEQVVVIQEEKEKAEQKARQDKLDKQQEETLRQGQEDLEIRRNQADKMGEYVEAMRASTAANEKRQEEDRQLREEERKAREEERAANQQAQEALKEAITSGFAESTNEFKKANEESRKNTKVIFFIVIGIVILILIIVFIAVMLAHKGFKNQEIQQQQYVQAFKMLAANQHQTNRIMIGGITDIYNSVNGGAMQIEGGASSRWSALALPEVELTEEEKAELQQLAAKCEEIGAKIDQVTMRKNNSKNVSELVYKIAIQLGLPQGESMLYFCAAMIYDAGFLGVDPELFQIEALNDEQREQMRSHVIIAEKHLDFVPKKYWDIFEEAATAHHENMDGSGYPKGLEGDNIPQVARIIRVIESYISLTSKRGYRSTLDKETAIEKLREQPHFYDPDVVDILEKIV